MIYFVTCKTTPTYLHMAAKRNPTNIPLIYLFPESALTEPEIAEWVAAVVNDHVIHRDVLIYSNSMICFHAFRVEIKEGRLKHNDFRVKFYETHGEHLRPFHIPVDSDGRVERWPGGFFNTFEDLLMRLL